MSNFRKIKLSVLVVFILNVIFATSIFSQDRRNPFQDCFPRRVEQAKIEEMEEAVVVEPVETLDVSVYKINGLIWGSYKSQAIINSEIYGVGDKLGEAEITNIDKNGVTLKFNNKEYILSPEKEIDTMTIGAKTTETIEKYMEEMAK